MILLMRRLILNPVLHIGQVVSRVGEGDLDVKSTVRSRDEIGSLSEKINEMISGLEEKNRLEIQNSVIEARNQENRKYLDNILEGLLLLGKDYRISEQYSSHLITLFGTEEVAGVYFPDFIYPDEEGQAEERRELEQFLKMLFENTSTDIDMILSINPLADKRLQVPGKEGDREIIVDANFQRIYSAGEVSNVMVIFEDKTEIVRTQEQLEEERERSQSEVEHISSLLQMGPEAFTEFQEDAEKVLNRLDGALGKAQESGPSGEEIASLLRDSHSLKGSARYLGFKRFGEQAHAAEEILTAVRDGGQSMPEAAESLSEHIEAMRGELKHSRELHDRFARFAESLGGGSGEEAPSRLTAFLDQLEKMTKEIAGELGKEVKVVTVSRVEDFPYLKQLRTPLIHMARNAVDHGVEEDEYERLSAEKPGTATIRFEVSGDDKFYRVIIADDGRGIDFEAVRKRAVEKGLIDLEREYSDRQLLSLLFSSSFSTRSEANELSGRGVGLDAVHEEVQRLGGRITVATHRGRGTKYTITLPARRAGGGA
jgi:signal transduction histidine kinase